MSNAVEFIDRHRERIAGCRAERNVFRPYILNLCPVTKGLRWPWKYGGGKSVAGTKSEII